MFSKTNGASADADDEFTLATQQASIRVSRFVSSGGRRDWLRDHGRGDRRRRWASASGERRLQFGHPLSFVGTIVEHPYPALMMTVQEASVMLVARGSTVRRR